MKYYNIVLKKISSGICFLKLPLICKNILKIMNDEISSKLIY